MPVEAVNFCRLCYVVLQLANDRRLISAWLRLNSIVSELIEEGIMPMLILLANGYVL